MAYFFVPLVVTGGLVGYLWQPLLAEDAYIALRYAVHLAGGYGLVYNIGERPVEGATSFLNTILVAGVIWLGVKPEVAAQLVAVAALLGACALLAGGLPQRDVHPGAALAAALALALSPLPALAVFGFDTALGVFCSTLVAVLLLRLLLDARRDPGRQLSNLSSAVLPKVRGEANGGGLFTPSPPAKQGSPKPRSGVHPLSFSVACLLLCLARPDATFLALPALLVAAFSVPNRRAFLAAGLLGFALPGLLYFLWRWHYFGYPFPTPFYVKHADAWFHRNTLLAGVKSILAAGAPALILIAVWLIREPQDRRLGVKLCLPWLIFLAAFALIDNEQNAYGRFQLPALPWILATAALAWTDLSRAGAGRSAGIAWKAAPAVMAVFPLLTQPFTEIPRYRSLTASTLAAGRALAPYRQRTYAGKTYGMLVSEAGVLPFTSGWRTLDAHGLNDPEVAQHGLTWDIIDRFRPDVIEFHVGSPYYRAGHRWLSDPVFEAMTKQMMGYCLARGFRLAAVCQLTARSPSYDWYFVNPRCPDAAAIARQLASLPGVSYMRRPNSE